jgi:hypothetical protein
MDNIKYEVVDSSPFQFQNTNTSKMETSNNASKLSMKSDSHSFDQKVRDYIQKNNPKLYILTPCYGSMCYVNYVSCLMNTLNTFRSLNIDVQVEFCKNDSLVSRARNNLIARAMFDKKMTHVLFIDSDISWEPTSILKLLVSNKHLVGGVYPLKHYNWDKLVKDPLNPYKSDIVPSWIKSKNESQLKDIIDDETIIQNKLLNYNVNYLDNYLTIDDNLAKVKHTATGFMMIQRSVLENMMKAFPSTKYVDDVHFLRDEENKYAYALFDCGVEDGHYYSEDWLFCHRWQKMGGDIFIDVSVNLNHTGVEDYKGSYIASIVN